MNYFIPFFILFLSACSTLKPGSLKDSLRPVRLEGEGRGRIGYIDQNYLFRFESLFQQQDWLLNLTIPMHGQETLVLRDLGQKKSPQEMQSLEAQIDQQIKKQSKLKDLSQENIVTHLRSLVRFVQAPRLGLGFECQGQRCLMDDEEFIVTPLSDGVLVKKFINKQYWVEFSALYQEKGHYSRTHFYLKKAQIKENFFSLELFWKNK